MPHYRQHAPRRRTLAPRTCRRVRICRRRHLRRRATPQPFNICATSAIILSPTSLCATLIIASFCCSSCRSLFRALYSLVCHIPLSPHADDTLRHVTTRRFMFHRVPSSSLPTPPTTRHAATPYIACAIIVNAGAGVATRAFARLPRYHSSLFHHAAITRRCGRARHFADKTSLFCLPRRHHTDTRRLPRASRTYHAIIAMAHRAVREAISALKERRDDMSKEMQHAAAARKTLLPFVITRTYMRRPCRAFFTNTLSAEHLRQRASVPHYHYTLSLSSSPPECHHITRHHYYH